MSEQTRPPPLQWQLDALGCKCRPGNPSPEDCQPPKYSFERCPNKFETSADLIHRSTFDSREQLEIFLERYFKYDVDNIYRDGLLIMFRNWTTVHSSRELVKQSIPSEHLELFKRRAMNEQCVLCGNPLPDVFFTVKLLHVATGEILTHNYCVPCKHS